MEETFPDIASLSLEELKDLIESLTEEEQEISYKRRLLHGKIDILRAELVRRLKEQREAGGDVISGHDIERLIAILSNDLRGVSSADVAEDDDED